jgi:hypothetical protein
VEESETHDKVRSGTNLGAASRLESARSVRDGGLPGGKKNDVRLAMKARTEREGAYISAVGRAAKGSKPGVDYKLSPRRRIERVEVREGSAPPHLDTKEEGNAPGVMTDPLLVKRLKRLPTAAQDARSEVRREVAEEVQLVERPVRAPS